MVFRCLVLYDPLYQNVLQEGMTQFGLENDCDLILKWHTGISDVLYDFQDMGPWDGVVVALPGALGMEAVFCIREHDDHIPLVWCSEDSGFALTSYRRRCSMFLVFPIVPSQMADAMASMMHPIPGLPTRIRRFDT